MLTTPGVLHFPGGGHRLFIKLDIHKAYRALDTPGVDGASHSLVSHSAPEVLCQRKPRADR